mmetsp:Transcript_14872/g.32291  ORF Transcript_14872/g.32291 Transcript_14872/m.32291 type:complete len:288 (+) Transcript_14872:67-930(+)
MTTSNVLLCAFLILFFITNTYSLPMIIPGAQSRIAFTAIEHKINTQNNDQCDTSNTIAHARDQIFELGAIVGQMCTLFLSVPHDSIECAKRPSLDDDPFWLESSPEKETVANQLGELFLQMFATSGVCGIDLCTSILKKVELNGRKYPVELCKGKSGKYTNYSEQTGITTTKGQSTIDSPTKSSSRAMEDTTTVEGITLLIRNFANERLWNRYHTPRNIALALLGEVGELAELFQWRGDEGGIELSEEELDKIGQEIADVSIYLLRLADICHVPLGELAMELLEARS